MKCNDGNFSWTSPVDCNILCCGVVQKHTCLDEETSGLISQYACLPNPTPVNEETQSKWCTLLIQPFVSDDCEALLIRNKLSTHPFDIRASDLALFAWYCRMNQLEEQTSQNVPSLTAPAILELPNVQGWVWPFMLEVNRCGGCCSY